MKPGGRLVRLQPHGIFPPFPFGPIRSSCRDWGYLRALPTRRARQREAVRQCGARKSNGTISSSACAHWPIGARLQSIRNPPTGLADTSVSILLAHEYNRRRDSISGNSLGRPDSLACGQANRNTAPDEDVSLCETMTGSKSRSRTAVWVSHREI